MPSCRSSPASRVRPWSGRCCGVIPARVWPGGLAPRGTV